MHFFSPIAAVRSSNRVVSLLLASLTLVACATTRPLDPTVEDELFGLYTCARYFHVIAEPELGDAYVDAASDLGKSAKVAPEDMIVVYLRARSTQEKRIEERALASGSESGSSAMDELLERPETVRQIDSIAAAQALYAGQCVPR